jgi:hypothetical protein
LAEGRCVGSCEKHVVSTSARAGGRPAGSAGDCFFIMIAVMICCWRGTVPSGLAQGARPLSISTMMQASAQTSLLSETGPMSGSNCSGAMYIGVPRPVLEAVDVMVTSASAAMPKSATATALCSSSSRLAGLRSWTKMPTAWRSPSVRATCSANSSVVSRSNGARALPEASTWRSR